MTKLARLVLTVLGVLVALLVLRAYWMHEGGKRAALTQEDASHETKIAALQVRAARAESVEVALRQQNAQSEAALAAARRRRVTASVAVDTARVRADTAALVAMQDSVIIALSDENRQLAEQVAIWQKLYASADSTRTLFRAALHDAEALRESWKREAQRPRYTLTDVGGGLIVGYGIGERNETAVLVGAGVVLVPRLLGAVGRLF